MVNTRRWFQRPSAKERQEMYQRAMTALDSLCMARISFMHGMTEKLIDQYAPLLEQDHRQHQNQDSLGELVVSMVFEELVANMIDKTEGLLVRVAAIFHESTGIRLWWPMSLQYAAAWLTGKDVKALMSAGADDDPDEATDRTQAAQEKLRINRGYRAKKRNAVGRAILGFNHWLTCNEGLFALRMVVVTIAIAIPSAIPNSAGFFYCEEGLWAVIMGQVCLQIYMTDFAVNAVTRVLASCIDGVVGLVAWHTESAKGRGNPYGLGAVLAVILAVLIWIRLYVPPNLLQAGLVGSTTCVLVVAFSWDNTHIPQYGNPGVGYVVFYRRLLLVLIGVGASVIVQLPPRPITASRHICKTLSPSLRALSDHYALLLSCWARQRNGGKLIAEAVTLQPTETLLMLDQPISLLWFEFSSSRFNSETLRDVKRMCHSINSNLARLLLLSGSLSQKFQEDLSRQTGLLDHHNIGDIMVVLAACEQALKMGDSLPEILPTPLTRHAYDYRRANAAEVSLTPDQVCAEEYRRFCVAFSAYLRFLRSIDELVLVVKGAVGEAHLVSKDLADLV